MLRANNLRRSLQSVLRRHHPVKPPSATGSAAARPFAPRPFCSLPNPPPSSTTDAELRKYIGYTILLLGCGAATYYSFPFPEDAKHKKAQLFRYARCLPTSTLYPTGAARTKSKPALLYSPKPFRSSKL
ncbi:UNVERIFIED_CONTAM: L-galactono-1,4-lactone dehydrogenase 1, mitochondrial [Sesamum calycinum]|uniref:L-galactono-1,4-lactone dehydrogenase 1, mitochondrial n=1 Tax=Sesamum calycinum TaxID=2727403 RepID=A0AAW2RUB9_9LAMI